HLPTFPPMYLCTNLPADLTPFEPVYPTYAPMHLCTYAPMYLCTYAPMYFYTFLPIY
ncbi:hypothetical protein B484DRAFT_305705, partial [Ochromonadaceae sp. CCMP2298]